MRIEFSVCFFFRSVFSLEYKQSRLLLCYESDFHAIFILYPLYFFVDTLGNFLNFFQNWLWFLMHICFDILFSNQLNLLMCGFGDCFFNRTSDNCWLNGTFRQSHFWSDFTWSLFCLFNFFDDSHLIMHVISCCFCWMKTIYKHPFVEFVIFDWWSMKRLDCSGDKKKTGREKNINLEFHVICQ